MPVAAFQGGFRQFGDHSCHLIVQQPRLIDRQHGPHHLLKADRVGRTKNAAVKQGAAQREEGRFDLPALVVDMGDLDRCDGRARS